MIGIQTVSFNAIAGAGCPLIHTLTALCEQIKALEQERSVEKRGNLEGETMEKIDKRLGAFIVLHQGGFTGEPLRQEGQPLWAGTKAASPISPFLP
jgi:hypothetical protein